MILSHMTPTPDDMYRYVLGPPPPPIETTTSLDSLPPMPPGQGPVLLVLGCHFNLVFSPHNFFLTEVFRGFFFSVDMLATCPK